MSARGHFYANAGQDATVEARVEALEKNVGVLSDSIAQVQNEMDKKSRDHAEQLKQEQSSRQRDHEQLSMRLEASETGGLHISAVGAMLLFVGVVIAPRHPRLAGGQTDTERICAGDVRRNIWQVVGVRHERINRRPVPT